MRWVYGKKYEIPRWGTVQTARYAVGIKTGGGFCEMKICGGRREGLDCDRRRGYSVTWVFLDALGSCVLSRESYVYPAESSRTFSAGLLMKGWMWIE